jgi:hypothetical protein
LVTLGEEGNKVCASQEQRGELFYIPSVEQQSSAVPHCASHFIDDKVSPHGSLSRTQWHGEIARIVLQLVTLGENS